MVSVVDRDPQGSELFAVSGIIGPDPVSGLGRKLNFSEYEDAFRFIFGARRVSHQRHHGLHTRLAVVDNIKGTVARDFWPLVFFMNRPHMGP